MGLVSGRSASESLTAATVPGVGAGPPSPSGATDRQGLTGLHGSIHRALSWRGEASNES